MKKIYSIIIALMLLTSVVNAGNRFSVASGNWSSITTWSTTSGGLPGAAAPVAGDIVTIEGGFIVTVDVASAALNVTVNIGTLNVTLANLVIGSTGNVTVNSGGSVVFSAANTISGGTGGPNGVLVNVNSGASLTTANAAGFPAGGGGGFNVTPGSRTGPNYNTGANYTFNAAGVQSTGTGITGAANLTFAGSGNKTITNAGTTVSGSLSMQGTAALITTAPAYGAASTLEYNGTAAQTTTGIEFPAVSGPFNLKINNSNGVTLAAARSISGDLTLTTGQLTTTAVNLLTIVAGGTSSGASNTNFVNGPMAKAGTTAFTFPVGKSGAGLRTIAIGAPTASTTFNAEFFRADAHSQGSTLQAPITQISACEYWVLNRTVGAGNASVTLSWGASSTCNGSNYITDPSTIVVARYTGVQWTSEGNTGTTGTAAAGTVTSGTVTSFSPFTIGTTSSANPLPVKLSNIKAYEKQQGVQIEWIAYSEENLSRYTVERSADGISFTAIGDVTSRNSVSETSYSLFDASPLPGVNFYRLKNIDFDGKSGLSSIVRVNLDKTVKDIMVYPNPATGGYVSLQSANLAKGNYSVKIFNAGGQQVYSQRFTHSGGAINQTIQLPGGTKSGLYSIELDNDAVKVMSKTFMVQ